MTGVEDLDRVMVDIETLGLDPGSAVLSIGAVRFGLEGLGETFEQSISLKSCQDYGLSIDAETLEWWLDQEEDAQHVLTGGGDLSDALYDFAYWYRDADEIWANSPSFDCTHLGHAFEEVGMAEPWDYYQERDYRTLASLPVAPDFDQEGVEHDALDDAEHQARVAAETLQRVQDGETA